MSDVKIPLSFGISAGAMARGKAAADPSLTAPENAKVTIDKNGNEHKRWTETGVVDQVWQEATKGSESKPKLAMFVIAIRMRPGEPNQNKIGWFRLMVHPDIAQGNPVSDKVRDSYENMTERALGSLSSLLDVAGQLTAEGGISEAKLKMLFPSKGAKSKLQGVPVTVKICQSPNEGGDRDKQEKAELFLPPKPLVDGEGDGPSAEKSSPFAK